MMSISEGHECQSCWLHTDQKAVCFVECGMRPGAPAKQKQEPVATCRGCGRELHGKAHHLGGQARYEPNGEIVPKNYWGGYVCSRACDYSVTRECLESGGAGRASDRQVRELMNDW